MLADYAGSPLFGQRERAALAFADALATSNSVPEEVFERLREQFSEDEIVEVAAVVAFEICAAKFNRALEIEGQGLCLVAGQPDA